MVIFSAIPGDLEDTVAYELSAIEYVRGALFRQNETVGGGARLTLGDLTEEGIQKVDVFAHAITSLSEGTVWATLNPLRPLAFSAAFKMQDMIAEWILRANGVNAWQFKKKLDAYDKLRSAGYLIEPALFAQRPLLARAFWELYRFFVPFRGAVVHSGGLVLHQDGTIEVIRGTDKLCLTAAEQGSYLRVICIITKHLLGLLNLDTYLNALVEGDFLQLETYHGQTGLTVRSARYAVLAVNVPASHIVTQQPLSVMIDFDHLCQTMKRTFPVEADGQLYFSVDIFVYTATRTAIWTLPIESVPTGLVTLQEGDSVYDCFLQLSIKST